MEKLIDEVIEITDLLQDKMNVTEREARKMAFKLQQHRILEDAFMLNVGKGVPGSLEAIAMALGVGNDASSIKDALYKLLEKDVTVS